MKRIFLMSLFALISLFNSNILSAKPKLHVKFEADVSVGRKKKECKSIWICLENKDIDITLESGMIKSNHGLVLDEDGTLSIAINQEMVARQDASKFKELESGIFYLDAEEVLPQGALDKMGYRGVNLFPSGKYRVTIEGGYFMIKLN